MRNIAKEVKFVLTELEHQVKTKELPKDQIPEIKAAAEQLKDIINTMDLTLDKHPAAVHNAQNKPVSGKITIKKKRQYTMPGVAA